jgi:hypothetical protein
LSGNAVRVQIRQASLATCKLQAALHLRASSAFGTLHCDGTTKDQEKWAVTMLSQLNADGERERYAVGLGKQASGTAEESNARAVEGLTDLDDVFAHFWAFVEARGHDADALWQQIRVSIAGEEDGEGGGAGEEAGGDGERKAEPAAAAGEGKEAKEDKEPPLPTVRTSVVEAVGGTQSDHAAAQLAQNRLLL